MSVNWGQGLGAKMVGLMLVRPALPSDADGCVGVLALLPEYFTPSTHDEVRHGISHHMTLVADDGGEVVGFIVIERRHVRSAEITYAAVHPARQVQGVGSLLLAAALDELRNLSSRLRHFSGFRRRIGCGLRVGLGC